MRSASRFRANLHGSVLTDATPYLELEDEADLEEVMASSAGPVVIGFWSSNCEASHAMAPHFDAVARSYTHEDLLFCRIQVDRVPDLAAPFGLRTVPSVILLVDGELVDACVGRIEARRLTRQVEWLLSYVRERQQGLLSRLFGARR